MPASYQLEDKGQLYYFIIFYLRSEQISFVPESTPLSVSYTLSRDGAVTDTGRIEVPNTDPILPYRNFRSLRKLNWEYLEGYDEATRKRAQELVDRLLKEIP